MFGHVLLALAAALAGTTALPPVDECAADPSFVEFRSALLEAAERRDVDAIIAALDDDVLVDFGQGKDVFRVTWSLSAPEQSDLWDELKEALRLGCAVRNEVRIAPSLTAQLDRERPVNPPTDCSGCHR